MKFIRYLLFEKKFCKSGLMRGVKRILLVLVACYIPLAAWAFTSNLTTDSDQYAAILLSADAITGHDHWAPPIAFLGSYPAWTLYFNSKGLKIDYIFSADKNDFTDVLLDEKYQSIVLVGHGSFNCWQATDGLISNDEIKLLTGKFKKKSGEWFQLTCPAFDFSSTHLGELVMAKENVYFYNGEKAGNLDFIQDALFAFSHLKAEKKVRAKNPNQYWKDKLTNPN